MSNTLLYLLHSRTVVGFLVVKLQFYFLYFQNQKVHHYVATAATICCTIDEVYVVVVRVYDFLDI